jgi:hypothetical protein
MDPPSPQLVRRLTSAGLCRPGDLRRCRPWVRRLARDIPAFETVWLDALVQARRLTAYQAEVLGSDDPGRLSLGPFVLVDRAGEDGRFTHFRARRTDASTPYLLSRLRRDADSSQLGESRLQEFLDRTAAVNHPGLALPRGFEQVDGRMWIASRWTDGISLQQLLVRRGRFAPACVSAIALQLCQALTALEDVAALHGDLRLRNVVLTSRGRCVLIAGGLRAALFHEQTIHANVLPDDCDGIAPELIGTGRPATPPSDIYALGCLLWELLAGRPPYPHGDPLARLAAHQQQRVPDIREWAPDTPSVLSELISEMTDPVAGMRPSGFRAVTSRLQRVARAPQRQLRRLFAAPVASPALGDDAGPPNRAAANVLAAAVVGLAACGVLLLHSGTRAELLSIARSPKPATSIDPKNIAVKAAPVPVVSESTQVPPLPQPDAAGVIRLHGPGPYLARDVSCPGKLELRGVGTAPALIVVGESPLQVVAEQLVLENVEVRYDTESISLGAEGRGPLLKIQAQQFAMRHCRLEGGTVSTQPAIEWTLLDAESAGQRDCLIIDSVFHHRGPAVSVNGPPSRISFENVLQSGDGPLVELSAVSRSRRAIEIETRRVTLRGAAPLLRCRIVELERFAPTLKLSLEDSALALDRSALVEFLGDEAPADWQRTLQITGEGSVVPPGAVMAGVRVAPDRLRPLQTDDVAIDGLMSTEFQFAGSASGVPTESVLTGYSGYGRSARPPGIEPGRLPLPSPTAYNSPVVKSSAAASHP